MNRWGLAGLMFGGALALIILWMASESPKASPVQEWPPIVLSSPAEVGTVEPPLRTVIAPGRTAIAPRPCKTDDKCLDLILKAPATWDPLFGYDKAVMDAAERAALRQRLSGEHD